MRGEEGPVVSRLYTNLKNVLSSARVPEAEGYTAEKAVEEASRCIQCKCEECIDSCVYLQYHKKYPKILTREIYNNVDIIMGDHMMNKAINTCSLCGQCKIVCPNGYDVAEICLKARENMVSVDKMSLAYHEFALLDMLFSNGEAFLAKPQPGFDRCRYVFFPGCQAGAIAPESVEKAYKDLCSRLPGGVGLVLGCCAAIAKWAGRTALHDEATAQLKKALESLGDPVIIAGCPTCMKMLSEDIGGEIKGIWEVLNETGFPEGSAKLGRKIILHDSCSARGDVPMQDEVRALAESLGCDLVETELSRDMTSCCGYGGLVSNVNKDLARKMAENTASDTSLPYLTYCMACRDNFAKIGRESMHILELVYGTDAGSPPDISEKRWNRLTLKNELLRDLWLEEPLEMKLNYELNYTPEARRIMDDRMILTDDVIAVIDSYRETGEAVLDSTSGLLIARKRIGNATFWVQFTRDSENSYTVHRAYSHRMNVERRQG
jgi:Fe-S oxidoreductase